LTFVNIFVSNRGTGFVRVNSPNACYVEMDRTD